MSKAIARIFVYLALSILLGLSLSTGAFAQYLAPGTLQVSRVQYDGNTNSGSNYVSPYGFPEIFNDQSGCTTGNSICDIAGIEGSIYIDQFNAEPGTAVQTSLSLPSTGTAVTTYPSPEPGSYITTSFSSKSEGSLNLSSDGTSLTYMGYQANDQLSDVSNGYSLNPFYQLSPNTYTQDPAQGTPVTITAATYTSSNGNTTITLSSPVTLGSGSYFTIAGMTQSGYDGYYATTAAVTNSSTLSFTLAKNLSLTSCNGSASCGGTALYDPPYGFYDREVALINSTGLVSLTPIDNADSGDNPRGALTVDEQEFYTFGNSDSTLSGESLTPDTPVVAPTSPNNPGLTIGIRCGIPEQNFSYLLGTYFASDRSDESAKKHVKDNNWRGAAIATDANGNQQLYVSKGSGGNGDDGVFLVQDPTTKILPACSLSEPNNNTATITPIFSAQATVPNGASYQTSPYLPFGFWFANPTTLYVADEGNPPTYTGGTNIFIDADAGTFTLPLLANGSNAADPYAGLEKWVYSGGTWTLAYTIQAGLNMYQPQSVSGYLDTTGQPINSYTYGIRNMAGVNNNDGTVTIYAITSQFSSVSAGESDPDSLVGITDSLAATTLPANEQFVTLQTSAPGELFRGVAYVPPAQGTQRQTQDINFTSVGSVTYGQAPIALSATASSGWPVSFSVTSGPATVSGNTLTITGAGQVTVAASQSGNTDYASATTSQTFTVAQETPTLTWPTPSAITYGTALSATQLDATSSVAGTFTYTPPAGTLLNAGSQSLSVLFTPDSTDYTTASASVSITVNQASQTITFSTAPPSSAGYQSSFTVVATASSGMPVLFNASGVCTDSSTPTYTMNSPTGICIVIAAQPGNSNYLAAPELTPTVNATKGTPVISWAPASIAYGTALGSGQLDASAASPNGASLAGTFKYMPAAGKILTAGTQTLSVTFTPTLRTDYSDGSGTVSLQVLPASSTTTITSSDQTVTQDRTGVATAVLDYNVASYKPTGAVTLTASTGESCTGTVAMATGNGSCKLYFVTTGTRTVTAAYSGDDNHTGSNSDSQSPAVTVTVNP